jgi:hypothetical protein
MAKLFRNHLDLIPRNPVLQRKRFRDILAFVETLDEIYPPCVQSFTAPKYNRDAKPVVRFSDSRSDKVCAGHWNS